MRFLWTQIVWVYRRLEQLVCLSIHWILWLATCRCELSMPKDRDLLPSMRKHMKSSRLPLKIIKGNKRGVENRRNFKWRQQRHSTQLNSFSCSRDLIVKLWTSTWKWIHWKQTSEWVDEEHGGLKVKWVIKKWSETQISTVDSPKALLLCVLRGKQVARNLRRRKVLVCA
jgi:hypothetical protein